MNTSFFYFIILWKGQAGVMVDGPLGLEGFRLRELYSIAALARYGALGGASIIKPYNRPGGRRKCNPPLVAGATTFPPQFGGAAK